MRRFTAIAAALLLFGAVTSASAQQMTAQADLVDTKGNAVGTVVLKQESNGVSMNLQVKNLPEGPHGVHLHAVGKCDTPDFMSASGHFNPNNRQHGTKNPQGAHAGDLPNLMVAANGTGSLATSATQVTLASGPTSLFDADGTAVVIHATADDEMSDPAGNSGARIACGILKQMPSALPRAGDAAPNTDVMGLAAIGLVLIGAGFFMRRRII